MGEEKHVDGTGASVVSFTFDGDELAVVPGHGVAHVVVRHVCDGLGVSYQAQIRKLREDPVLSQGVIMMIIPSPGGPQAVACIDLRSLPLWLAKIHPGRVKKSAQAKLIRYQRECAEVLADRFIGRRGVGEIPEELREAAAVLPGLEKRVQELEEMLASFPRVVSDKHLLGTGAARTYILDPLQEIARLKALAIQKTGGRIVQKLRFASERSLRAELGFGMSPANSWTNYPTARLGEACCAIARMRAEAQCLLDAVQSAKQMHLAVVK